MKYNQNVFQVFWHSAGLKIFGAAALAFSALMLPACDFGVEEEVYEEEGGGLYEEEGIGGDPLEDDEVIVEDEEPFGAEEGVFEEEEEGLYEEEEGIFEEEEGVFEEEEEGIFGE
ncbi:MAG: hypothetical protein ACFB8W_25435 [Elainellaceae cyanobacterium]